MPFPLPVLPTAQRLAVRGLNALLAREPWARARLARHVGKTARLVWARLDLALTVLPDGFLELADAQTEPAVVLTVVGQGMSWANWWPGVQDAAAFAEMTHIAGDAAFAQIIAELARDLRPDWQDALAERVGDVVALRITQGAHALFTGLRTSGERLVANVAEYLSEESGLLLAQPAFKDMCDSLTEAQTALDALEQRLAGLEQRLPGVMVKGAGPRQGHTL